MSSTKRFFFVVVLLLPLGFFSFQPSLNQSTIITNVRLEFSRVAWDFLTTCEDGDYGVCGDFWETNLIISSSPSNVSLSDLYYFQETCLLTDLFYQDSPFYVYYDSSSSTAGWWIYWLNASHLESFPPSKQFNLSLSKCGRLIRGNFRYFEVQKKINISLISDTPLTMSVNPTDQRIISGSDHFTTLDNQSIRRRFSLTYDSEGYLKRVRGGTYISYSPYFYEYDFEWLRESITIDQYSSSSSPPFSSLSSLSSPMTSPSVISGWSFHLLLLLSVVMLSLKRYKEQS